MNAPYSIGIDVGGTKTALGLFASDGVLIERTQYPSTKRRNRKLFLTNLQSIVKNLFNRKI